jgi:hypothetical protein
MRKRTRPRIGYILGRALLLWSRREADERYGLTAVAAPEFPSLEPALLSGVVVLSEFVAFDEFGADDAGLSVVVVTVVVEVSTGAVDCGVAVRDAGTVGWPAAGAGVESGAGGAG